MKVLIDLAYDTCPDHDISTKEDLVLHNPRTYPLYASEMAWFAQNIEEEELPRILASTVALFQNGAGTIAQCLEEAIVWERG